MLFLANSLEQAEVLKLVMLHPCRSPAVPNGSSAVPGGRCQLHGSAQGRYRGGGVEREGRTPRSRSTPEI